MIREIDFRIPLKDRIAIISGGAGDIGKAIAAELAQRGADIALGDLRTEEEVSKILNELSKKRDGVRIGYTQIDVSNAKDVESWVNKVEKEFGTPDIVIPCAGQVTFADSKTITQEQWNRELQVNLNGAFYLAQAGALKMLEKEKKGHIVFIGSFAGMVPQVQHVAYGVSKAGVHALTHAMALEFGPFGIKVNAVAPGNVEAGLTKKYYKEHPEDKQKELKIIPNRKLVSGEELAWHIVNLCDPRNENITGAVLPIDGGMSSMPDFRVFKK